jgi:hypothetical protein
MNENCCEHFGMSVAEKFGCKVKGARRTHAKYVDLEALISIHGVSILTAVRISPSRKSDLVTEICQINLKLTTPFVFVVASWPGSSRKCCRGVPMSCRLQSLALH